MNRRSFFAILLIALIFVSFGLFLYGWMFGPPKLVQPPQDACTKLSTMPRSGNRFSITQAGQGSPDYVGVSDGSFIFTTPNNHNVKGSDNVNISKKCEGAIQFRQGNSQGAGTDWTQAVTLQNRSGFQQAQSNDAEALIYRENSHVLSSDQPYITFVIGTVLTGDDKGIGSYVLQGAYIAQEEFNRSHEDPRGHPIQILLLVANFSSNVIETPDIGKKIEDDVARMITTTVANPSLHVKGILIGLPYTFDNTLAILNQSNVPVVLSGAYSNTQLQGLTNIFPVSASTQREGQVAAQYVQQALRPVKIALFVGDSEYAKTLADAFASNTAIWKREIYTTRDSQSIEASVTDALTNHADFIFFAGDAKDADVTLDVLQSKNADVKFMGGDALYELGSYTGTHYKSLYFTSFAFPDEWAQSTTPNTFPTLYRLTFSGWPLGRVYGYARPDNDALLSFDGLSVLAHSSEMAFATSQYDSSFSPSLLNVILTTHVFQGFSGKISFGFDRANKAVVVLYVTDSGFTREAAMYGCLSVSC